MLDRVANGFLCTVFVPYIVYSIMLYYMDRSLARLALLGLLPAFKQAQCVLIAHPVQEPLCKFHTTSREGMKYEKTYVKRNAPGTRLGLVISPKPSTIHIPFGSHDLMDKS